MHESTPIYVALDDSKRKVVVGILRPGGMEPELREMPKEPHVIRRLFQRLTREGRCGRVTKPGSRVRPVPTDHGLRGGVSSHRAGASWFVAYNSTVCLAPVPADRPINPFHPPVHPRWRR